MTKAKKSCALCGSIYHISQACDDLKQSPKSLPTLIDDVVVEHQFDFSDLNSISVSNINEFRIWKGGE